MIHGMTKLLVKCCGPKCSQNNY